MSASDYTSQKNSNAIVSGGVYSNKGKVSTQAYQRAFLKRVTVTGPRGYVAPAPAPAPAPGSCPDGTYQNGPTPGTLSGGMLSYTDKSGLQSIPAISIYSGLTITITTATAMINCTGEILYARLGPIVSTEIHSGYWDTVGDGSGGAQVVTVRNTP